MLDDNMRKALIDELYKVLEADLGWFYSLTDEDLLLLADEYNVEIG